MSVMYKDLPKTDAVVRSAVATLERDGRVVILPPSETAIIGRAYREPTTALPMMDDLLEATWEDAEWQ
jgi:hypothetical protein